MKFKAFINESDISGYVDGQEDLKLAKEKLSKENEKNLFINNAFSVIEKQIEKTQSSMFENEKDIIQRMIHGEFAFIMTDMKEDIIFTLRMILLF